MKETQSAHSACFTLLGLVIFALLLCGCGQGKKWEFLGSLRVYDGVFSDYNLYAIDSTGSMLAAVDQSEGNRGAYSEILLYQEGRPQYRIGGFKEPGEDYPLRTLEVIFPQGSASGLAVTAVSNFTDVAYRVDCRLGADDRFVVNGQTEIDSLRRFQFDVDGVYGKRRASLHLSKYDLSCHEDSSIVRVADRLTKSVVWQRNDLTFRVWGNLWDWRSFVAIDPSEKLAVMRLVDQDSLAIMDMRTGQTLQTIRGIRPLCFSFDGELLAVASNEDSLAVWGMHGSASSDNFRDQHRAGESSDAEAKYVEHCGFTQAGPDGGFVEVRFADDEGKRVSASGILTIELYEVRSQVSYYGSAREWEVVLLKSVTPLRASDFQKDSRGTLFWKSKRISYSSFTERPWGLKSHNLTRMGSDVFARVRLECPIGEYMSSQ